ncbi:MAG: cell division protein ZapE [Pseudomonadota bacterium]
MPGQACASPAGCGLMETVYKTHLARHGLMHDASQFEAIQALEALAHYYQTHRLGLLAWLRPRRTVPPPGLYLYGPPGRGKSMVMDLAFAHLPAKRKLRVHFHEFMQNLHEKLATERQHKRQGNVARVARKLTADLQILCFDEFYVEDIADAMILGQLFQQWFAQDLVVIVTSNTPVHRLYEHGLQRELFMPFIRLLQARLHHIAFTGAYDYREVAHGNAMAMNGVATHENAGFFVLQSPSDPTPPQRLIQHWQHCDPEFALAERDMMVEGRQITLLGVGSQTAIADFGNLLDRPTGVQDYLSLARHFPLLAVINIPPLMREQREAARRFAKLVDIYYDQQCVLALGAFCALDGLFVDQPRRYQRTLSRLKQMTAHTAPQSNSTSE